MNGGSLSRMETFKYTQKFRGRGLPGLLRLAHFARALILFPVLLFEWKALVGRRPSRTTLATTFVNDVSNATHGRGLETMNAAICWVRNRSSTEGHPRFDSFSCPSGHLVGRQSINAIIDELRDNGFSQIRNFVDPLVASGLNAIVSDMSGATSSPATSYQSQHDWQRDLDGGPRYTMNQEEIRVNQDIERVALNGVIREVARLYLGCSPILASTQAWTTRPPNTFSPEVLSEAAMAFHCDADYFGFLKFFVLLTDVSSKNGPFTFIGGSHRGVRHVAGRMSDTEVVLAGDVIFHGTGQAGDLIIADTKGWHKASPPESGYRTLLQVVYASSLLGFPS